ncbi:MAG: glycosyltransferase family 2 protein [Bdellovibrionales bacterium]|nr:glycosyltransferase family 2 protein [Bdellovibrionales bacterium]
MSVRDYRCVLIIPALNEQESIAKVLSSLPPRFCENVIVVDNGSTDRTAEVALQWGAQVVRENQKGYGKACLRGIEFCESLSPEIVAFIDADFSDDPRDLEELYQKLCKENLDLVIGSRTLGLAEAGALLPQARIGNFFAGWVMALRFHYRYSDLGPMRLIRQPALKQLKMQDQNFGWTIEMQVKALSQGLRVGEVSVHYKKRIGTSKITGTIKGCVCASIKILFVLFKYVLIGRMRGH